MPSEEKDRDVGDAVGQSVSVAEVVPAAESTEVGETGNGDETEEDGFESGELELKPRTEHSSASVVLAEAMFHDVIVPEGAIGDEIESAKGDAMKMRTKGVAMVERHEDENHENRNSRSLTAEECG
ncbi:hypothetical protein AAF712_006929 [Marasmius tenuissimus]|uniref:Uncharacterized protein n=1 Tax=Marasmius tenuissimus TaxID=585030 RepID=A0ABR2ZYF0_9AGAR